MIRGPSVGKAFQLKRSSGVIGRQQDCAVIVADLTISRHHVEYQFQDGQMSVKDLESQNGTYLEKALLKPNLRIQWAPGDVLHVGSTDLVWVPSVGQAVPEPETIVIEDKTETASIAAMMAEISKNELPVIGHSQAIQEVKLLVTSLSRFNVPILISGEIGTGKAMIAYLMHRKGPTHRGIFQSLNCSFLRKDALEKALFGPDSLLANYAKDGHEGGTLFLEQIESLPLDMQARLLEQSPTHQDYVEGLFPRFRLVTACNRLLASLVKKGGVFRSDLLKRLKWLHFSVPPLRDRPNDIPQILDFCLRLFQQHEELPAIHFTPDMVKLMQRNDWPGNVREFKNFVRQILAEARRKKLNMASMRSIIEESEVLFLLLDSLEKQHQFESFSTEDPAGLSPKKQEVLRVLRANHWRVAKAAQSMGLSRTEFFRRMKDTVRIDA